MATLLLAGLAVWLFRRKRPIVPVRRLLPFAFVLLVALLLTGYPMFRYGFNWVSYCNDDMGNYCLGGKLFLNHAQLSFPRAADILHNRDGSLVYWFFYVPGAMRRGAEEMLGWTLSMTGLAAQQAFMPVILAFHMVLIAAVGALVLMSKKLRGAALLACVLLAFSSLITLGTIYQLFGQVTGLGSLAAASTVLLRTPGRRRSEWIFTGLLFAGTCIYYPEVLPFLIIAYVLYHGMAILRGRETVASILKYSWPMVVIAAAFLNVSLFVTLATLVGQSAGGLSSPESISYVLFPYYMTPAGFAYFWGFLSIPTTPVAPMHDFGIVIGAVLFFGGLIVTLLSAWRGRAIAFVTLVMFGLCFYLFYIRMDFGLFKIAMYIQPFLLGTIAIFLLGLYRHPRMPVFGKVALALLVWLAVDIGSRSQRFYVLRSEGEGSGFVEIPHASGDGLISVLKNLPPVHGPIVSDTANVVLAKFEASFESQVYFPAKDFIGSFLNVRTSKWDPLYLYYRDRIDAIYRAHDAEFASEFFDMHGALPTPDGFRMHRGLDVDTLPMLHSEKRMAAINKRNAGVEKAAWIGNASDEKNYLLFTSSEFGTSYYVGMSERAAGHVSMYQVEPDFFFHGNQMASLGRVSLFRVLHPSPGARLVLEYTASLNADGKSEVPPASVIGEQRQMLAIEGRGSARFFSPPIRTQKIDGGDYLVLDMGSWGSNFSNPRSWIMSLYGADVRLDSRRVVGFTRDISLISAEEYAALDTPACLQAFPAHVGNKNLEYSGIYEDGWVAEASYAILKQPESPATLDVSFSVPELNGRPA